LVNKSLDYFTKTDYSKAVDFIGGFFSTKQFCGEVLAMALFLWGKIIASG
jgi:hypothetical protein